jgi:cysteine desulfurase
MIYLDHNATTPVLPAVRDAMLPYLDGGFGNPSSIHAAGRLARNALDAARSDVAALVGVHPRQVIFTGGGTEANNLALRGVAMRALAEGRRGRILIGATEHSAVREPAKSLAAFGFMVDEIPVDGEGRISTSALQSCLGEDVLLVSIMQANNETGCIQDIPALAGIVRQAGAIMHTDAVQAAGKLPVDFNELGAQLLTLSAHKIGGPKGVGALITDGAVDLLPQVTGGGQEGGRRGGTENLAGIAGFAAAAVHARQTRDNYAAKTRELRDLLETELATRPAIRLFGTGAERLPNTCQFAVAGMDGETVQMGLDRQGIAVSTGSACHSGSTEPSHVLLAMGIPADSARGAIRVSFAADNTKSDVEALLNALDSIAGALPTNVMQGGGPTGW